MFKLNFKTVLTAGIMLAFSMTTSAQGDYWKNMEGSLAPSTGVRKIIPATYHLLQIDQARLQSFLKSLPGNAGSAVLFELPTPDGKSRSFSIWSTPVFAPELQAKFPDITTYTAVAVNDPTVTAKLDYTTKGFHAMVFAGDATYLIDPYSNQADGYYIVYNKKDYRREMNNFMRCDMEEHSDPKPETGESIGLGGELPGVALRTNGSTKKKYRLALSCTGEYAAAVDGPGPTKAGVLSAMTTTMNRVNGIYEREVAATMEFIGSQDDLIYTSASSDPFPSYANNNGGALLDFNQDNTDDVVGSAVYDIGHIFSTGGGGIAQLGCVCSNNSKAMGVTGSPNPVGDAYDVDYVAHEMGHQFGAEHTFNKCSGTESAGSAYEPGSGSTILAYAGICGSTNNLQEHSDDYFHAISLNDISQFITTGFWGAGGSSCGVSSTGGTAPTVPSFGATYAIPYRTPFELTAPAISANGVTYCWEEWDLGYISQGNPGDYRKDEDLGGEFTTGPAFRSFDPAASRTRVFPKIERVITNNLSTKGERIPEVARTSRFKLTVRTLSEGWGTFNTPLEMITLNVINTGAPFKVTAPSSSVNWETGSTQTVQWDVAQTNQAPVNCQNVNIYMSADGGHTYPYVVAENVPNTGSASITVPNTFNSTTTRLKVKGADNVFFDISDVNFTVSGEVGIDDQKLENHVRIYPNPAGDILSIEYGQSREPLQAALYDATGRKVWNGMIQDKITIDTKNFARGLYFLHLSDSKSKGRLVKSISLQ